MFCPKCGKQVSEGAVFCNFCGKPLNRAQQPPAQQPQAQYRQPPAPQARQQAQSRQPTPQVSYRQPQSSYPQAPARQPKKSHTGLIVTLIVLLLAAGTVLTLFLTGVIGKKGGESLESKPSNEPGVTQPSVPQMPTDPDKIESLSAVAENPTVQSKTGVEVTLSPFLFDYTEDESPVTISDLGTETADNGDWKQSVYDVDLGGQHALDAWIDIRIPYDASFLEPGEDAAQCVAARYFNEETGEWDDDVLYDVDTQAGCVVIHTDHCSKFASFTVRKAGMRSAYISSVTVDLEGLSQLVDLQKSAAAMSEYAENGGSYGQNCYQLGELAMQSFFEDVLLQSANQGNDVVGNVGNALQLSDVFFFTEKYAKANETFWKRMSQVGLALGAINLGVEIMKPNKTDGEIMNIYKDAGLYALNVVGDTAMGTALVGVTLLDKSIQSFGEAARGYVAERMENCYLYYNEKANFGQHHARTSKEWRQIVADCVKASEGDEDSFRTMLENNIDEYARRFFALPEDTKYEIQSEFAEHFSGGRLGVLTKAEEEALISRYKERMYQRLSGAILKEMQNEYLRKIQAKLQKAMNEVKNELNQLATIELYEELKEDEKPAYAGYFFRFAPLSKDAEAHKDSWTDKLDKDGKASVKVRVIAYILAGMPDRVDLYQTEKDLEENKLAFSVKVKFAYPKTEVPLIGEQYPTLEEIVGYYQDGMLTVEDFYIPQELLDAMKAAKENSESENGEGCDINIDPNEVIGQSRSLPFTLEQSGPDGAIMGFESGDEDGNFLADRVIHYDDKTGVLLLEPFTMDSEGEQATVSMTLNCVYADEAHSGVRVSGQLIEEFGGEYAGIRIVIGISGSKPLVS